MRLRRSQHVPHASRSNGRKEKDMDYLSPPQVCHSHHTVHTSHQPTASIKKHENRHTILLDHGLFDSRPNGPVLPRVQHDALTLAQVKSGMMFIFNHEWHRYHVIARNMHINAKKRTTGYSPSIFLSAGRKDSNNFLFVRAMNHKAPPARIRLTRKEWTIQFMTKIATESTIIGAEQ